MFGDKMSRKGMLHTTIQLFAEALRIGNHLSLSHLHSLMAVIRISFYKVKSSYLWC